MKRIDVVRAFAPLVTEEDLFITALGGIRSDWLNYQPGGKDNTFFVSGMGSPSPTALGLAVALPHRRVVAWDTDGSLLMNTGALATIGSECPPNLTVLVLDNEVYESIGGPSTLTSRRADLAKMAEGAGCVNCATVRDVDSFADEAARMLDDGEFGLLVAKIEPGNHPWPPDKQKTWDGIEDKYRFMRHVEQLEGIKIQHATPPPYS
jgi:sulfopyruvate decarboxylase subunit beta